MIHLGVLMLLVGEGITSQLQVESQMPIDVGSYTMKMSDAKGKMMQDVGKYVTIFKKVDGQWKIIVDTFNSDAPAPTPVK